MILSDPGINWVQYYKINDTDEELIIIDSWRVHKTDKEHPKVDDSIAYWCDAEGRSGVDLKHYKNTREKIHYKRDYVQLDSGARKRIK